ncbi:response regulator [Pedococcus sp.]|jgi:CheY-like chemotaxis protein|uniref:response regulator n=1 Tax=Pedococcus sp. TaxID=2860345 RepID=UPI002E1023ED|nr:response regulator [Pedococcus sp.]
MERGGLIYVCDDTEQIRRLIRLNLELEGYDVEEQADGQELLERLATTDALPDVITLDAQMLPKDGWWAIARIRADERLAHIPVVMVTASVQQQDRVQAQGSGLDAFVAKPFDPLQLIDIVRSFMAAGRGRASAP